MNPMRDKSPTRGPSGDGIDPCGNGSWSYDTGLDVLMRRKKKRTKNSSKSVRPSTKDISWNWCIARILPVDHYLISATWFKYWNQVITLNRRVCRQQHKTSPAARAVRTGTKRMNAATATRKITSNKSVSLISSLHPSRCSNPMWC